MSAEAFELPAAREAHEPPEARGLDRAAVRLMVTSRGTGEIGHRRFHDLPEVLSPGDVLVVNTSATLPAAVDAHRAGGAAVQVRFAGAAPRLPASWWVVELRAAGGATPLRGVPAGERLTLPGGASTELVAPYAAGSRLWLARLELGSGDVAAPDLPGYLARHGAPIRYAYVPAPWPLSDYQTAFATDPGSAEMPSAGRPFTPELVTRLVARGVLLAPVTLHTGVSSPERHEPPYPEAYAVPATTARLVNAARRWGGRIVAVGTTVARALETVAAADGTVTDGRGWTGLVIGPERGLRAVDGLITGWHEPQASHLQLVGAIAGGPLLDASYRAALEREYLWHEFGDSHLVLP
jgi:S-adenosylmethionine:tRNA ribosyltransferase-isomerase